MGVQNKGGDHDNDDDVDEDEDEDEDEVIQFLSWVIL